MSMPLSGGRAPVPPRLTAAEAAVIGLGLCFIVAQVWLFGVSIEDASLRAVLVISGLIAVMLMPRTATQLLGIPRTVAELVRTVQTVQQLQLQLAAAAPVAGVAPAEVAGQLVVEQQPVAGENT